MTRRSAGLAVLLLALLPAAGCSLYTPMAPEERTVLDTCRSDAERVFNTQHREQLSERDSTDSPFSGNTLPSDPNRGLSDQYEHEQMVDNCMRGNSGPSGRATPTMTDEPPSPPN